MKANHVDLSICIVNWNSGDILKNCLKSIYDHSDNINIEIIVVDNNSSDYSCRIIERYFPNVILIKNDINLGFGKANNLALAKCKGNHILLLNPDIILKKNCLRDMMDFLNSNSNIGCIGCKLVNLDRSVERSYYKNFPTPLSELKEGLMLHRLKKNNNIGRLSKKESVQVAWVVGACMMFKREVLMTLGGFDEQYFMYSEDADLCYRLRLKEYQVHYLPNVEMVHYKAYSSNKQSKSYFATVLQKESRYKFMLKHYGFYKAILYRSTWLISGLIRFIAVILLLFFSSLFFRSKKKNLILLFEKYKGILFWSIGYENWATNA